MSIELINGLTDRTRTAIAKEGLIFYEHGQESCGLLLKNGQIHPCENIADNPRLDFAICPKEYAQWEPETTAIYHSHVNGNQRFSDADALLCRRTGKTLILYDVVHSQFSAIDPSGNAPLLGRDFVYGIYDCWSLVRDWFKQELQIELLDIDRAGKSIMSGDRLAWDCAEWDEIDRRYRDFGFSLVDKPKRGDVLAMSLGSNNTHVNHLGLYLGGDRFIQQLINRKSCEEVWGSPWSGYTVMFWRHERAGDFAG